MNLDGIYIDRDMFEQIAVENGVPRNGIYFNKIMRIFDDMAPQFIAQAVEAYNEKQAEENKT